ncbi:hypothetical protein Tco_1499200 [Tanacetum coccineum]
MTPIVSAADAATSSAMLLSLLTVTSASNACRSFDLGHSSDGVSYSLLVKQVSLSSLPQSHALTAARSSGHRDVMRKTPTLSTANIIPMSTKLHIGLYGPKWVLAVSQAAELSPIAHPRLGVVKVESLQRWRVSLGNISSAD